MHFRLLSYNIHKGIGGIDRKYDLARAVDTIRHYDPDVAMLQEVDDGVPRSRMERQVDKLVEATGMPHFAYQRNVRLTTGYHGNAILSRHPLAEEVNIDLTIPPKKRRRALAVRCRFPFRGHIRTAVIVNVHLGLAGLERRLQIRRLLVAIGSIPMRRRTPLVIAGDYNDVWGSLGRGRLREAGFRTAGSTMRTFPAAMPLRALDRVFYRGDLRAAHTFVGRSAIARQASDHLPLVVDFEFTRL